VAQEPWTAVADGVFVDVRLTPRGGRDAIEGIESRADGRAVLKARVRAAPFEGEANDALCRLLARALDIPPRDVAIAAGATARIKRVLVKGQADATVAALRRVTSKLDQGCARMCAAVAIDRQATSAIPAEGDLVENAGAELFRRTGDGLAAKRAIKLDGGIVFRQRPYETTSIRFAPSRGARP
jgi:uncharacterized protein